MEKKLYRSRKVKSFAGVCGGLANYINMDVTIIRLAWALLSLLSIGSGIIIYIVCAMVIPEEPEDNEFVNN